MRSSSILCLLVILSETCRSECFLLPLPLRCHRVNNYRQTSLFIAPKSKSSQPKEPKTPDSDNQVDPSQFAKIQDEERLQKVIARAGISSRRDAEKLILDGRVVVNGKLITELGTKVNHRKDIILVDGKKIVLPDSKSTFWVAVNKPKGTLTTVEDEKNRDTLLDLVPKARELRLLPVGRLDRDTTGLMILTNDVGWIHPLTHPSFRHFKRYEVVVKGSPSDDDLLKLTEGIELPGDPLGALPPCKIAIADVDAASGLTLLDVTLEENRSQQIQRMFESAGCTVVSMKRTEFGPLKLTGLRRGQWRELTASEVDKLKKSCQPSTTAKPVITKAKGSRSSYRQPKRPGSGYAARTPELQKTEERKVGPGYGAMRRRAAAGAAGRSSPGSGTSTSSMSSGSTAGYRSDGIRSSRPASSGTSPATYRNEGSVSRNRPPLRTRSYTPVDETTADNDNNE